MLTHGATPVPWLQPGGIPAVPDLNSPPLQRLIAQAGLGAVPLLEPSEARATSGAGRNCAHARAISFSTRYPVVIRNPYTGPIAAAP